MGVPLVSASFSDVLDVRFRDIFKGTYEKGKSWIPDIFDVRDSTMADERFSELTPMGKLQTFLGAISYDGAEQGYDVTATHIEKTLGIQIQRKLWDDDQFGVIDEQFSQLAESAFKTHEDDASELFSGAFSASSAFFSHTEAVALCSASHTSTVSGVSTATGFDNYDTAALSPTTLTANITAMRQFKDAVGDRCDISPDELWVPIDLEDRAMEILKTPRGIDSAEGTVNVHEGRLQLKSWYRLTDATNWFLCNGAMRKKNALWFWKCRPETAKMEGFDNLIAKGRIYTRYSFLRRDWRWIFGCAV